jgi:hypothetical protein
MRPKLLLAMVSLVWLLLGAWFVATPYLAVWSLERAASAGDTEGISERVDFPALRESIQGVAQQRAQNVVSALPLPSGPLAELGKSVAAQLATSAVDTLVTPETVALMLQGTRPGTPAHTSTPAGDFDLSMGYSALNRFVVEARGQGTSDPPIQLIFTRSGLANWRLTSLRDPSLSKAP